jgi:HlyD family type I secretion membrane fusion protein
MDLANQTIEAAATESDPGTRWPILVCSIACGLFFAVLLGWSWFVPLERAILAPGSVVIEGARRQVQHLEGGIVGRIMVKEGTVVVAGQTVLVLDTTVSATQVELLRNQWASYVAQVARLKAEIEDGRQPDFPGRLLNSALVAPEVSKIIEGQLRLFEHRREALMTSLALLGERNGQIEKEIAGLQAEVAAQDRQLELISQELNAVEQLVARGLERTPRLLLLQRQQAEIDGAKAQNLARVARAGLTINENNLKKIDLKNQFRADASQKLQDEEGRLADTSDKLKVAEDTLRRATLRAPVGGKVLNLRAFTEGGVINAREPVMEIVPLEERLVIDAHVTPNDIDPVRKGAKVKVRFPSLPSREVPIIEGHLEDFSADRQTDNRTGTSFYTARVLVEPTEFERLGRPIYPGIPAEVTILAGSRSLLNYLFEPLFGWYWRAMREK